MILLALRWSRHVGTRSEKCIQILQAQTREGVVMDQQGAVKEHARMKKTVVKMTGLGHSRSSQKYACGKGETTHDGAGGGLSEPVFVAAITHP